MARGLGWRSEGGAAGPTRIFVSSFLSKSMGLLATRDEPTRSAPHCPPNPTAVLVGRTVLTDSGLSCPAAAASVRLRNVGSNPNQIHSDEHRVAGVFFVRNQLRKDLFFRIAILLHRLMVLRSFRYSSLGEESGDCCRR